MLDGSSIIDVQPRKCYKSVRYIAGEHYLLYLTDCCGRLGGIKARDNSCCFFTCDLVNIWNVASLRFKWHLRGRKLWQADSIHVSLDMSTHQRLMCIAWRKCFVASTFKKYEWHIAASVFIILRRFLLPVTSTCPKNSLRQIFKRGSGAMKLSGGYRMMGHVCLFVCFSHYDCKVKIEYFLDVL